MGPTAESPGTGGCGETYSPGPRPGDTRRILESSQNLFYVLYHYLQYDKIQTKRVMTPNVKNNLEISPRKNTTRLMKKKFMLGKYTYINTFFLNSFFGSVLRT
jgi:hypothetical protein